MSACLGDVASSSQNQRIDRISSVSFSLWRLPRPPADTLHPLRDQLQIDLRQPLAILVEVGQREGCAQPFVILLRAPGRPEGFHLQPPTDPYVNLSIHTARRSRASASFEIKSSPEVEAHPGIPVGQAFHRAASSPSLTAYYRRFNATTG